MPDPIAASPLLSLTPADLESLQPDLEAYYARYGPLFVRSESRAWGLFYLQGLLSDLPRKSAERLVLGLRGPDRTAVRSLQLFLNSTAWRDAELLAAHWQAVAATLGTAEGVLILDGSDFAKQGQESVGVKRQYCGELGKKANCQAGVFLGYASDHGATLVHRGLYLPAEWVADPAWATRRARCGVPAARSFRTRPQIGVEMIAEVLQAGSLPVRWVTCDEAFGQSPAFLDQVAALGLHYCAEVPHDTRLWPARPRTAVPASPLRGRPVTRVRLAGGEPAAQPVAALAAALPPAAWTRYQLQAGSRGGLRADCAALRVVAVRESLPGPDVWLLLRRHPRTGVLKTFLCHAPADCPLPELVRLTACRWPIETCFQQCKQHLGMGHYEVRSWTGWHHHMTLCLLAHFFLVQQQVRLKKKAPALTVPQVHAVLQQLLPRFLPTLNQALDFLSYRERYNLAARWAHIRRQLRDDPLAA